MPDKILLSTNRSNNQTFTKIFNSRHVAKLRWLEVAEISGRHCRATVTAMRILNLPMQLQVAPTFWEWG